jgi:hypothetical protein
MNTTFEGHTRTGKEDWLTPPTILHAIGQIDLDPCAPINAPWPTATKHYTKLDDGLKQPWDGFVFCNPPYGDGLGDWLQKCAEHGNCIALVFARTETKAFQNWVFPKASGILFLAGRISFYTLEGTKAGTPGSPSLLISYGSNGLDRLAKAAQKLDGYLLTTHPRYIL